MCRGFRGEGAVRIQRALGAPCPRTGAAPELPHPQREAAPLCKGSVILTEKGPTELCTLKASAVKYC